MSHSIKRFKGEHETLTGLPARQHVGRKQKRVFRYQLADVHVGMGSSALGSVFYRGGIDDKPKGGDFGSYFADELGELTLSNTTSDYRKLKDDISDFILSRPLLLHNKKKVASRLLESIRYKNTPAFEAFAKLTYFLCKDLGVEFIPFVEPFCTALMEGIVDENNVIKQKVSLIHNVFLTLTGWLRVLSPMISDNKEQLLTVLTPLVSQLMHKSHGISRLVGECLSVAVRKITNPKITLELIRKCIAGIEPHLANVTTNTEIHAANRAVGGLGTLFFECIRGVNGRWHSKFSQFIQTLLPELENKSTGGVLHLALKELIQLCTKHGNPASILELIDLFAETIKDSIASKKQMNATISTCCVCLKLLGKWDKVISVESVKYMKTFLQECAPGIVKLIKSTTGFVESDGHIPDIPTSVFEFCLGWVQRSTLQPSIEAIMSTLLEVNCPVGVLSQNIASITAVPSFAANLRSQIVKTVDRQCECKSSEGNEAKLLLLIISLYEESQQELSAPCSKLVKLVVTSDPSSFSEGVRWLGWKLAALLPQKVAKLATTSASKIINAPEESPIIVAHALQVLSAAKNAKLVECAQLALQKHTLSPSVVAAASQVLMDVDIPKKYVTGLIDICGMQLRSNHPIVRQGGCSLLRKLMEEDETAVEMLDACSKGESLRANDMAENRLKVLAYDEIVGVVRKYNDGNLKSDSMKVHLTIAANILLGALTIRYRPLWSKAQEGLHTIATIDMSLFWPLFVKQLEVYKSGNGRDARKIKIERRKAKQQEKSEIEQRKAAQQDQESDDESDNNEDEDDDNDNDDDESTYDEEADQLEALWEAAVVDETSTSDATTIQSNFKSLWGLMESLPQETVSACANDIFSEYQSLSAASSEANSFLSQDAIVASFLRVLTKQSSPDSLPIAKAYEKSLWETLTHENTEVQKLSVAGLKHFQAHKKIAKYEEKISALVEVKGLKNRLLNFDFEEIRAENIQMVVFKILRPKLWQNKKNTRQSVLQFTVGVNDIQFSRFMDQIIVPIMNSHQIFTRKTTKFLEFVTSVVDALGARLLPWVDFLMSNTMVHLEGSYNVKEGFNPARHHKDGRRFTLKLLTKLFKQFPDHDYPAKVGDDLSRILQHPISDIGNSAGSMGALISLLAVFAEDEGLVQFLGRLNALPAVCKLLGHKSVSIEVYTASLKMIESVIEVSPDTFTPECCATLVSGIYSATSTHFKSNTKAWSASVSVLSENSDTILSKLGSSDKGILSDLMSFLIDSLKNRSLKPTEQATDACTSALSAILPKLPESSHVEFMSKMAKLFYSVKFCSSRAKLGQALTGIVTGPNSSKIFSEGIKQFMTTTCNLIEQTNDHTVDAKGEARYNFDTRISGFYACEEAFSKKKGNITAPVATELRALHLLPICYNLAYFINDTNQSIRTTAGLALRSVITALKKCSTKQDSKDIFTHIITPVVVQGARFGLKHSDRLVQNEWLQVYGITSQLFSLTPGLSNQNSDLDFFHNITHPQASRQLKALAQFRQKSSDLPETLLEQIFIPLFVNLLQQWSSTKKKDSDDITVSESGKNQALIQSLLQTFTTVAKHLSWHKYYRLVMDLLQHEVGSSHAEKSMTSCISQVLDGFHFLPKQEVKLGPIYEDDEPEQPEEKVDVQTSRIGDILIEKLIPAVHKFWKNSGAKVDDNASAVVGATVDKVSLVRLPLACTIIRLLKFVPSDVDIAGVVDSIVVELVSNLKTKKAPQREAARETLADCLSIVGAQYLKKVIHLLRSTLVHGYQLHVMGFTVVSLLNRVEQFESNNIEHIDDALGITVDVLLDDNIGTGGTEKEVEELAKTMKEVKKNRSLEGLELIAKLATPETVADYMMLKVKQMFTPNEAAQRSFRPEEAKFKRKSELDESEAAIDAIDTRVNLDLIQKVKTIMRRMARGLVKNKNSTTEHLLDISKETLLDNSSTRDSFLEQFEAKQEGMKIRLVDSEQATKSITNIRAAIKKDQLVQNEPVRKDRGFEKREVNSQKRQFGSARRKGAAAGKKRIRIPEKAARTTLQSMECIDEFCISIAWNIVNATENDSEKAKVSVLVEPMVTVLSGDSSDSVITLALLTLHEILKLVNHVTTPTTQIEAVLDLLFIVIERTGEIRSACFRLMSVLLLHRQADLSEQQALICCSLVRSDLDKKATFIIPALHMLKAIVIRKIEIPEVYDLVPVIQEKMLHHANSAIVSQLAASVIARFLTDWRMSEKKLESHVDYVIQNLQYPVPEGRLALLHLLEIIFGRFPVSLIKKEIDYFFVPLAHRLMADDSKIVRKKTASTLGALFQISGDAVNAILKILKKWIANEPGTQIIALQVLSVFFKQSEEMTSGKVAEFIDEVIDISSPPQAETSTTSAGSRRRQTVKMHKENWELAYHSTILLEVLIEHRQSELGPYAAQICTSLQGNLVHSHPWVRTAASRALSSEFTRSELSDKRGKVIGIGKNLVRQLADLSKTNVPSEEDLVSGLGGAIETDIDSGIIHSSIKNLVWVFTVLTSIKDQTILWKDIKEAAITQLDDLQQLDYRKMNAPTFLKTFGVVRPAAVMRLLGTLLVKLYADTNPTEDTDNEDEPVKKKPSGARARKIIREKRIKAKRKACDVAAEEEREEQEEATPDAVTEDPIMKHLVPLIGFLHACCYVPAQGSPLAVACREVLSVVKHSLKSEKFVRLFAKFAAYWKETNIKKNSSLSFKSSAKGRTVIAATPKPKKARKMLTTTDGATVQAGTTKRKRGTGPITKKKAPMKRRGK